MNFAVDAGRISEIGSAGVWSTMLRVSLSEMNAFTQFSTDQYRLIYSEVLREWLLNTQDEDGEKLYAKIKRRWPGVNVGEEALSAVRNEHLQIIKQFLKDQTGHTDNIQDKPGILRLVCTLTEIGRRSIPA